MVERTPAHSQRASSSPAEQNAADVATVALAKRDPAAFAPLYLTYVESVYRYSLRRLRDKESAEDAHPTTFTWACARRRRSLTPHPTAVRPGPAVCY